MDNHDKYLIIFWEIKDFPLAGSPTIITHTLISLSLEIVLYPMFLVLLDSVFEPPFLYFLTNLLGEFKSEGKAKIIY